MFTKILTLLAFLAIVQANTFVLPETKIGALPVARTTIHGPSGEITQEKLVPVVSHEAHAVVETPEVPVVKSVVHHEVPLVKTVVPWVKTTQHSYVLVNTLPYGYPITHSSYYNGLYHNGLYYY